VIAVAAALTVAAIIGGLVLVVLGLRPTPAGQTRARPPSARAQRVRTLLRTRDSEGKVAGRRRLMVAFAAGLLGWLITGLAVLALAIPVAVLGLPRLLGSSGATTGIDRLEGLEEWTRNLAGVLAVGVGLEQAITASLRSAPAAIRPQVATLTARLAARWDTAAALRAFADDLDDATGDLVAASLILSARRRGAGLVAVLESLAASVAEDVRARRMIDADRAKPRSTARAITIITLVVLLLLAANKNYIEPYTSPLGEAFLALLLTAYAATLLWMRQMTLGRPTPRFLSSARADEHGALPTVAVGAALVGRAAEAQGASGHWGGAR
jgi:Flp pilus assembly protein TadB